MNNPDENSVILVSPVHKAAYRGDLRLLQELIEGGSNPNQLLQLDYDENVNRWYVALGTPLMVASAYGQVEIVKYLISIGANVNASTEYYPLSTALLEAIKPTWDDVEFDVSRAEKIVGLLLQAGSKPNHQDFAGNTALFYAAARRLDKVVEILLSYGANPLITNKYGNTPLLISILHGSKQISTLLANGIELPESSIEHILINEDISNINVSDYNGAINGHCFDFIDPNTLLMEAVEQNNFSIVKRLVELGADVNRQSPIGGDGPLHIASRNGFNQILQFLLDHGALIDLVTGSQLPIKQHNHTSLMEAVWYAKLNTAKLLIEHGADINAKNQVGLSALAMAEEGLKNSTEQTLENDEGGEKRLAFQEIVDYLISVGAKIDQSIPAAAIKTKKSGSLIEKIRSIFDKRKD